MNFYSNQIFHIYNQGNNRRQIFYTDENYEFFLFRLRGNLAPFGDVISYCLMPNHFHILFFVRQVEVTREIFYQSRGAIEWKRRQKKHGAKAIPLKPRQMSISKRAELVSLNLTVGQLQKGYARAINAEQGWSGSLFRAHCKVKDGMINDYVTTNDEAEGPRFDFSNHYAKTCIQYIHDNPVKAGMVINPEEYRWSSAKDYAGLRQGNLCNLDIGRIILKDDQ